MRGEKVEGNGPDGRPLSFVFYRDLDVAIRYFRDGAHFDNLILVASPRFGPPVLAVCWEGDGPRLLECSEGDWIRHLQRIKEYPRIKWQQVREYDPSSRAHQELVGDILMAAGLVAQHMSDESQQVRMTAPAMDCMLHQANLRHCKAQVFNYMDDSPWMIRVVDAAEDQVARFMHHSQRGWETIDIEFGPWVDDLFAAYDALEQLEQEKG